SSNRTTFLNPPRPDSLQPDRVDLAEYEKKYAKYDGVFLNSEYTIENTGSKSAWESVKVRKLKFLVLNPDAEWLTTFNYEEDPGEQLLQAYIRVTSPE